MTTLEAKLAEILAAAGITSGTVAEIGADKDSLARKLDGFSVYYLPSLTTCADIPDASFDAVVSVNVFDQLTKPWQAAKVVERILKPGGITFHVAPFVDFDHKASGGFFRCAPKAFRSMFDGMETLYAEFHTVDPLGNGRSSTCTVFAARKR